MFTYSGQPGLMVIVSGVVWLAVMVAEIGVYIGPLARRNGSPAEVKVHMVP